MMVLVIALLIGFGGLVVLFAPFWLSGALSDQEHEYGCSGEPREAQAVRINWISRS